MASFSDDALRVVRSRLSCTTAKPCNTSVDTLRANIARRTIYIRLIIFWRGETGLFFIAIYSLSLRGAPGACHMHIDCHGLNHSGIYLIKPLNLFGHLTRLIVDLINGANLLTGAFACIS